MLLAMVHKHSYGDPLNPYLDIKRPFECGVQHTVGLRRHPATEVPEQRQVAGGRGRRRGNILGRHVVRLDVLTHVGQTEAAAADTLKLGTPGNGGVMVVVNW